MSELSEQEQRAKQIILFGWIGVDFDGTLAVENHDGFPIPGAPILRMVNRVKNWLAIGREVRIVTARVGPCNQEDIDSGFPLFAKTPVDQWIAYQREVIEVWCELHIGKILPVTATKDFRMIELWDDRAIQLIPNTGITLDEEIRIRNTARMTEQVRDFLNT